MFLRSRMSVYEPRLRHLGAVHDLLCFACLIIVHDTPS